MLPLLQRRPEAWADPARELERALFNRLWDEGDGRETVAYPVDIHEDQSNVYIEAELPGFKKDDVNLTLEQGVLTIAAERRDDENKSGQRHLGERRFHRVQRSFTLPSSVDESKVDAKLENGVLYLTLSKREEVKPRRIEVK